VSWGDTRELGASGGVTGSTRCAAKSCARDWGMGYRWSGRDCRLYRKSCVGLPEALLM
jgi:hypothetical protein